MARKRSQTPDLQRRSEIVQAAARVFHREGYPSAKVQDVAEELGLLKGSLYYYIKTKEDLLVWLYQDVHEVTDPLLEQARASTNLSPLDRLYLFVESQTRSALGSMEKISVYYRDMNRLSPERQQELAALRRPHEQFVVEMIKESVSDGLVDAEEDPWILMSLVFSTIISVYRWYPHHHSGDNDSTLIPQTCALFAVRGLCPDFNRSTLSAGRPPGNPTP